MAAAHAGVLIMSKLKTLLYATDLSENSAYAFRYALELAEKLDARLHLVHALEPLSEEARMTLQLFIQNAKTRDEAMNRRADTARALIAERQKEFWNEMNGKGEALRDRVGEIEVVEGFAAEVILKRAESLGADMIIMGSHRHGISHTFLGQMAKRVLRRARVPVLVVPYTEE